MYTALYTVSKISELPVYTSDEFFTSVGSWLGLLAGGSLLSVVELTVFLFVVIKEKCK